jgi:hypothetical protein
MPWVGELLGVVRPTPQLSPGPVLSSAGWDAVYAKLDQRDRIDS